MNLTTYTNAVDFLSVTRSALEANEAANNLMYGLSLRLERNPDSFKIPPYYGVVESGGALIAAALMTPPHNLIVLSVDPAGARPAFDRIARDLLDGGWPVPGVLGPNAAALAFTRSWQQVTGEQAALTMHERVYELRAVEPPPYPGGAMRPALADDLELVTRWMAEFQAEAFPGDPIDLEAIREGVLQKIANWDLYLWQDREPAALAGRARSTPHGWTVGPVYTPPAHRRKGYATALTAEISQMLLDSGKQFVSLFTNLANPTSNSIYQKIGYRPVCDFDMYRFVKA